LQPGTSADVTNSVRHLCKSRERAITIFKDEILYLFLLLNENVVATLGAMKLSSS
jgi:hypothetical protein